MSDSNDNNYEKLRAPHEGSEQAHARVETVGNSRYMLSTLLKGEKAVSRFGQYMTQAPIFENEYTNPRKTLDFTPAAPVNTRGTNMAAMDVSTQSAPEATIDISTDPEFDANLADRMAADLSQEAAMPEAEVPVVLNSEAEEQADRAAQARKRIEELTDDNFAIAG